jgi:hypothetical protein
MRVLLTATNRLARTAAADALRDLPSVVDVHEAGDGIATPEASDVDLVIVEHSVDTVSLSDLDEVTGRFPGAAVVSVALVTGDAYSWVRLRRADGWYFVEETGMGPMASLIDRAAAAVDAPPVPVQGRFAQLAEATRSVA